MAGLVGFAKLIGRPAHLNSKCVSYCVTRCLSAESGQNDKPRKPVTHFLMYLQNVRPEINRNNPGLKIIEQSKIASKMYQDLSEVEKQKIQEKSSKLLEEYKQKLQQWETSLTPEQKVEIKAKMQKKSLRRLKRTLKENNKPSRGPNSFILFTFDQRKLLNIDALNKEDKWQAVQKNFSDCVEKWKNLPEVEKEAYKSLAAEDSARYEREMQKWEQEMIKKGKGNLVRKATLRKHVAASKRKMATKGGKKTVAKKAGVKSASSKSKKGNKSKATKTTKKKV